MDKLTNHKQAIPISAHLPYTLTENRKIMHNYRISKILNVAKQAKDLLSIPHPSAIDLGCGRGELLKGLKELGYIVYGLDIDPVCVKLSSQHGKITHGDIMQVDTLFKEGQFDLVITSHTLEHIQNPLAALISMRNIMKNYAIIAVPNVFYSFNLLRQGILGLRPPTNPGHFYEWDASNFENLITNHAGLKIVSWHADWVRIVPFSSLRRLLNRAGVLRILEKQIASRLFPHLSESLIVLCTK